MRIYLDENFLVANFIVLSFFVVYLSVEIVESNLPSFSRRSMFLTITYKKSSRTPYQAIAVGL